MAGYTGIYVMEVIYLQKITSLPSETILWKMFNITICSKKNYAIITLKGQLLATNVAKRVTSKGIVQFLSLKNHA